MTLGIALLRGRALGPDDRGEKPLVVVINESFARQYFPGQDPVGSQLDFWGKSRTIVGVVKGERFGGPQRAPEPALYAPLAQVPMSDLTLVVRAGGNIVPAVRSVVRTIDQRHRSLRRRDAEKRASDRASTCRDFRRF